MFTGRKDKSEKMLTKLDQLKKEIADLADELARGLKKKRIYR